MDKQSKKIDLAIRFLKNMNKIGLFPVFLYDKLCSSSHIVDMVIPYCEAIEDMGDYYVTVNIRPKYSDKYFAGCINGCDDLLSKCAIIVQGPIIQNNHFTYESVKMYKKMYPKSTIIISTWSDEDEEYLSRFDDGLCYVVRSEKPCYRDHFNINYQNEGVSAGIKLATQLGMKYVLKTRSDFRIQNNEFLHLLLRLIEEYPVIDAYNLNISKRIIAFNAGLFQPYYVPDFVAFGEISVMGDVYSHPLITDISNKFDRGEGTYKEAFLSRSIPEIEFFLSFFERKGYSPKCEVSDWWNVLRDYFVILSLSTSESYWCKYHIPHEQTYLYNQYNRFDNRIEKKSIDFFIWDSIYRDNCYSKEYEKYVECEF